MKAALCVMTKAIVVDSKDEGGNQGQQKTKKLSKLRIQYESTYSTSTCIICMAVWRLTVLNHNCFTGSIVQKVEIHVHYMSV